MCGQTDQRGAGTQPDTITFKVDMQRSVRHAHDQEFPSRAHGARYLGDAYRDFAAATSASKCSVSLRVPPITITDTFKVDIQ